MRGRHFGCVWVLSIKCVGEPFIRNNGHKLLKATIGQMVPRDPAENDRIVWSDLQMELNKPCDSGWPHCKCDSKKQKRDEPITCRLSSLNLRATSPDL